MSDANPVPDTLDSVLRKYARIWIWSILLAAVATLSTRSLSTVSFNALANFGVRSRASELLFLSLRAIVPSTCTLAAVWYLLLFLRHHIVPILFPPSSHEGETEGATLSVSRSDGGRLLWHAFALMVLAVAADIAIALLSFASRAVA